MAEEAGHGADGIGRVRIMFVSSSKNVILPASVDTRIGTLRETVLERFEAQRVKLIVSGRLIDDDNALVGSFPPLLEGARVRVVVYNPLALKGDKINAFVARCGVAAPAVRTLLFVLTYVCNWATLLTLRDFWVGYFVSFVTYRAPIDHIEEELSRTPAGPRRQQLLFERARERHRNNLTPGDTPWI